MGDGIAGRDRPGHRGEAHLLQRLGGQRRRLAALDIIGQAGPGDLGADAAQLLDAERRLDEEQIGAGLAIELGPLDGGVEPFDRAGIGAGHDDHRLVLAGIEGRLQLGDHLGCGDHLLALHMAAALGRDLILDEQGGDAGALIGAHGAGDIGRPAIAGIGIGQQRQLGRIAEPGIELRHLAHAELGHIGLADQARGGAIAAAGRGLEAGPLDQLQGERVMGARQDQNLRRFNQLAEEGRAAHRTSLAETISAECESVGNDGPRPSHSLGLNHPG